MNKIMKIENELKNSWCFITCCICNYYFDRNIIPTVGMIVDHWEYRWNKIQLTDNEIQSIIDKLVKIYY